VTADTYTVKTRGGPNPAQWTRYVLSPDAANAPDSALSFEHGKLVFRVLGGTGLSSQRHELWTPPKIPAAPYGTIKSRWASHPPADGLIQHVHAHRVQQTATKIRAVVLWDGIFGSPSGGVWESNLDGTGFVSAGAAIVDRATFTDASRDGAGLVTAVGAAPGLNTRWKVGDPVVVGFADVGYNGSYILSAVTDTTAQWTQTNGGVDASAGAGNMILLGNASTNFSTMTAVTYPFTDAVRANGIVTATGVPAGHNIRIGDRVLIDGTDNTYDGRRYVSDVDQTTFQPKWIDNQADDAAAGAGTIVLNHPAWCESRIIPGPTGDILQARFWPDKGLDLNGGAAGPLPSGPPSWESFGWTLNFDLSTVAGATVPASGKFGWGAAHHSSNSPVMFDSLEVTPLGVATG